MAAVITGCVIGSIVFTIFIILLAWYISEDSTVIFLSGTTSVLLCFFVSMMIISNYRSVEINDALESSLGKNYPGYTNLKLSRSDADYSFVCDGQKYTCDFDYDNNKTLTVYSDSSKTIDGIYIDGQKQDSNDAEAKSVNDTTTEQNQSSSQTSEVMSSEFYQDDNSNLNQLNVSDADLTEKIQSKILEKYNGAMLTEFDTIVLKGSFTYNNVNYSFSWQNDILEVVNNADLNDATYYKIMK